MKFIEKLSLFVVLLSAAVGVPSAAGEILHLGTSATSLVLDAGRGEELKFVYYGAKLTAEDLDAIISAGVPYSSAYQAYGKYPDEETPLWIIHSDGNMTTRLVVREVITRTDETASVTRIRTGDEVYPFDVDVCYRTYSDCEVIETWVEITNREKSSVVLNRYDSACIPIHKGDVWASHLSVGIMGEAGLVEEPLLQGTMSIRNKDGVRNSLNSHAEIMFSLDGRPDERQGATIGAALCYSGNYELTVDSYWGRYHQFRVGMNPDNSSYRLAPHESFITPPVALTFSMEGKGGVSRNFHRWGRNHMLRHGNELRKVLLNSWEGVYFDINEEKMLSMISDAAALGAELFVMDDGWFGGKYRRNDDSSALGDWTVDRGKLPGGLKVLTDSASAAGIGFGLWIEPEMADISSELYEKHPDWIIKAKDRDMVTGRGGSQVVLDFTNPKVRDYAVNAIDCLLKENPGIEYIKWDANSGIYLHGSQHLRPDRMSHLNIEWHRGLEEVFRRVRELHPDIVMQACGAGGGRVNWGTLKYFDEFWTSDITDAVQRIYIQWGTSHFFPAMAMASHISASPNHQTHRRIPVKFRADVAMSGRLGLELQPADMTDEEKTVCMQAISDYKSVRNTIQMGELYRLVSPFESKNIASLMYVSEEKDDAVMFWYRTEVFAGQILPLVKLDGLDRDRIYTITELDRIDGTPLPFEGKSFSGAFLMDYGLDIPYRHDVPEERKSDFSSRVLHLEAKD